MVLYHLYLKNLTNPNLSRYKLYDYIYNNFEYLTGISLDDLYNEDMERVIENRKTARRIEMDSVIEDVTLFTSIEPRNTQCMA